MSTGKDLIWVSKDLADQFKQLDSVEEQEKAVKKIIESKKLSLDAENEYLSENLLHFKSVCLSHRKELQKVYDEESLKIESLWEECGDVSKKIREHSKKIADEIKPIRHEIGEISKSINELKSSFNGLDSYMMNELIDAARSINNMSESTRCLVRDLLNTKEKA